MNKYTAQEQAYKNGYELGKKVKQEEFAEQFVKGFNEALEKEAEWLPYKTEETYGCEDNDTWYKCSACGRNASGRCYEDEWYSYPMLTNYCSVCGAKMKKGDMSDDR